LAPNRAAVLTPILLGLTLVTELVDAGSYLALGRVFTANMTGNVVLLGFAAAGVPGLSVGRSGAALVAFLAGAAAGGRLALRLGPGPRHRWTGAAFGLESALLLAAMLASLGARSDVPIDGSRLYSAIALTGLAMGVRNATARKLAVPDLTTTVLTLTITGLAADSSLAGGSNAGWARRIGSIVALLAGAALGAGLLASSLTLALGAAAAVSALSAAAAYLRDHPRLPVD
jgi:uncharacterized membrane protein YoaK (UPF0700 family)